MTVAMSSAQFRKTAKERDVKASIVDYLNMRGVKIWVNPRGGASMKHGGFVRYGGPPGASDLFGILPGGRFLAIETKAADGRYKATEDQVAFIEDVNKRGGLGIIARSVDDVITAIAPVMGGW